MIPQIFFTNQSKLFVQLNKQNNINLVHTLYSMNEQTQTNPAFKRIKRLTPDEFRNQCENDNKISDEKLKELKELKQSNKKQSDPSYWGTYDRMVKFGYSINEALYFHEDLVLEYDHEIINTMYGSACLKCQLENEDLDNKDSCEIRSL